MPPVKKTFEEQLERLQEIIELLESESLPLADSLALYKEGMQLTTSCQEQLSNARNEIVKFSGSMLGSGPGNGAGNTTGNAAESGSENAEGAFAPFKDTNND